MKLERVHQGSDVLAPVAHDAMGGTQSRLEPRQVWPRVAAPAVRADPHPSLDCAAWSLHFEGFAAPLARALPPFERPQDGATFLARNLEGEAPALAPRSEAEDGAGVCRLAPTLLGLVGEGAMVALESRGPAGYRLSSASPIRLP